MEQVKDLIANSVIVYSKPNCMQCEQTKNYLKKKEVDFSVIDVSTDPESFNKIIELGYRQVPVVTYGDDHWSGFQPGKLNALSV